MKGEKHYVNFAFTSAKSIKSASSAVQTKNQSIKYKTMGRGDQKSRKGKIAIGSYGKLRPRKLKKNKPVTPPAPAATAEKK